MVEEETGDTSTGSTEASEGIPVRIPRGVYESLSAAATLAEMAVEDFVLWAAANKAESILRGDTIVLSEEKWVEFMASLDTPAENLKRVKETLKNSDVRKIVYNRNE